MLTQKYYAAVVDSNNNYEIHWSHFKNADAAREDIEYSKKFNEEFNANTFEGRCNKIICVDADYDIAKIGTVDYHKMIIFPA